MLINRWFIVDILKFMEIDLSGILHIGAHTCEEVDVYEYEMGVPLPNMLWIDADQDTVDKSSAFAIPNQHQGLITDKDDEELTFHIASNNESSSIFEFGTHSIHHPQITYSGTKRVKSITLDTWFKRKKIDPSLYTWWTLDIQGSELLALKGAGNSLKYAKVIYTEVNTEEVYKNCPRIEDIDKFLHTEGFTRVCTVISEYGWGDAMYVRLTPELLQKYFRKSVKYYRNVNELSSSHEKIRTMFDTITTCERDTEEIERV
jgi:hypothetical protein